MICPKFNTVLDKRTKLQKKANYMHNMQLLACQFLMMSITWLPCINN